MLELITYAQVDENGPKIGWIWEKLEVGVFEEDFWLKCLEIVLGSELKQKFMLGCDLQRDRIRSGRYKKFNKKKNSWIHRCFDDNKNRIKFTKIVQAMS